MTAAGPLVIHVLALDPHRSDLRLRVVLARERLVSPGETVSSMAARTGAIAGINGDYFDIGQTNQPLNVVVVDGSLLRTPSRRVALEVTRDRAIRFVNFSFAGGVRYGASRIPLTAVDEWPPQGGASLLLPAYGDRRGASGVKLFALDPIGNDEAGRMTYRVAREDDAARSAPVAGPTLAFGPAALAMAPPPSVGETVALEADLDPPLAGIASALGGGPLLLAGGAVAVDTNEPAPEERNRRFPVSGAALDAEGTLLMIAVDGGSAALSVGLTRPEFGALMLGLGARDGMAFDSGGSATLVARVLGDARASVLNAPSDGVERPVADGLFVYSDAPRGQGEHLVVSPDRFVALAGARIALRGAIVDSSGNRMGAAAVDSIRADPAAGSHVTTVRETGGANSANVTYETVTRPARIAIEPASANPDPGRTVHFTVRGFTVAGAPVELGDAARWRADRGTIDAGGTYRASTSDATVVADVAGIEARVGVRVGSHLAPLDLFGPAQSAGWHFASLPNGGRGGVAFAPEGELDLTYDFSAGGRAAYAEGDFPLPGEPSAFALDVRGDGSEVGVRAAFVNRFGERRALTLVKTLDWRGWQRVVVALLPDLTPPVRLRALYVVPTLGGASTHPVGTIGFRASAVVVPGVR